MYESIYIYILYVNDIYHDSTWKHLRQPCANLAPSLCFAGFPCVTPHNELVKSYKSVGCVPPRLKFLFRTFDRLPYRYHIFYLFLCLLQNCLDTFANLYSNHPFKFLEDLRHHFTRNWSPSFPLSPHWFP